MSLVSLDDSFFDHPKAVAAGEDGANLFVRGLAYCRKYNTAGKIHKAALDRLSRKPQAPKHAASVVAAGLWEDLGAEWYVHDYDTWYTNDPATKLAKAQKLAAMRAKSYRDAKAAKPTPSRDANGTGEARDHDDEGDGLSDEPVIHPRGGAGASPNSDSDADVTKQQNQTVAPQPAATGFILARPPAESPKPARKPRQPKAPSEPMPFTIADLIAAFARRCRWFASTPFDQRLAPALTAVIRDIASQGCTLADVEAAGALAATWGLPLGVPWLATTGKLADAIGKSQLDLDESDDPDAIRGPDMGAGHRKAPPGALEGSGELLTAMGGTSGHPAVLSSTGGPSGRRGSTNPIDAMGAGFGR